MKVWVTKYALTKGIVKKDVEISSISPSMVVVGYEYYHGEGRDWHRTFDGATKRAEEMRKAKIVSLEKSLARLKSLRFVP